MERFTSLSAGETRLLGIRIGRSAAAGDTICLVGSLGAGKTQLARGIAQGLDIPADSVASPTYSLIAEHLAGRIPFYHMDMYRLNGPDDLGPIGYDDYLSRFDGVIAIEWADRIAAALPMERLDVCIEFPNDGDRREFLFSPHGERARALIRRIESTPIDRLPPD